MLRLITFDVCNTLIRVRSSPGKIYSDVAKRYGVKIKPKALNDSFNQAFHDFYGTFPNFGAKNRNTAEVWWNGVVKQTFHRAGYVDDNTLEKISSTLYQEFTTASHWEIFPETVSVLEHLQKRSYHLAVISNFDERLETILESLCLKKYFSFIACSFDVGICKPSSEIFNIVLSNYGVKAKDTLHVGDNVNLDYKPAVQLGIRSLIVNRFNKTYSGEDIDLEDVIPDLTPLLKF